MKRKPVLIWRRVGSGLGSRWDLFHYLVRDRHSSACWERTGFLQFAASTTHSTAFSGSETGFWRASEEASSPIPEAGIPRGSQNEGPNHPRAFRGLDGVSEPSSWWSRRESNPGPSDRSDWAATSVAL